MTGWHSMIWRTLPVSRVCKDIRGPDSTQSTKCRVKHSRVTRHRKAGEGIPRSTRERVQHVGFAILANHIIEERTEFSSAKLPTRGRHCLNQPLKIKLASDSNSGSVENLKRARLLTQVLNPCFERLVNCTWFGIELFALTYFVVGAAQNAVTLAFCPDDLPLPGEPTKRTISLLHSKFNVV